MTTYTVIGVTGRFEIEADRYRINHPEDTPQGELYFYEKEKDDAVAMFPSGTWHGVMEEGQGKVQTLD